MPFGFGKKKNEADIQRENFNKAQKIKDDQEVYEARRTARQQGRVERAKKEGKREGMGGGGFGASFATNLNALGGSINNTEKMFGFSNGVKMGGGLDFGLGGLGGQPEKKQAPQRITKISKSGTVTIYEPAASSKKKQKNDSPYNLFDNIDDDLFG
jgi:hypothetical protein